MNLIEAQNHYGVREWGRVAPFAVRLLRSCVESPQGCWLRPASTLNCWGYSLIAARSKGLTLTAHRGMYELVVGSVPERQVLDHLCHGEDSSCPGGTACLHRRCINPAHLEPVTRRENTLRGLSAAASNAVKTHCKRGHEFTPANTYVAGRNRDGRGCKTCHRDYLRSYVSPSTA